MTVRDLLASRNGMYKERQSRKSQLNALLLKFERRYILKSKKQETEYPKGYSEAINTCMKLHSEIQLLTRIISDMDQYIHNTEVTF